MTEFMKFLKDIGPKWQQKWEKARVFNADPDASKPKYFLTFPYPYVNGSMHMGHGYTVLKLDFMARLKRMQGYNVLFPQGFHATGEPIVGMAKRLKEDDPVQQKVLTAFGVQKKDFKNFYDPVHIVNFFVNLMTKDMKDIGLSYDWRRKFITTSITPVYSKFVEWQYLTLRDLGRVKLGNHPVIWCPEDQSPTGDHDRLVGDGVSIVEYVLLKFPFEDKFFLPATLRPETIYGVTNMYLHPDAMYVTAEVDGEKWIVSQETIIKLKDQEHQVQVLSEHSAREFFGKYCKNPITNKNIILLPATFVNPEWGSGVVMSVPAHAPIDWVAIQNIKNQSEQLEKEYGIAKELIQEIEPISLISIENYGEFPAIEIIKKMGITDQNDPEIEKATKEIYKIEFHNGVCKEITGKYQGRLVKEVKDDLINDFLVQNIANIMYEPADTVICRCGTRNHVKIMTQQWFLTYGDSEWKDEVHRELDRIKFIPPVSKAAFTHTVDWLNDKACARKSGLGTPLPWDPNWIVETLSDSTIYMAYYTISKHVNEGKLKAENAVPELFDYIFLNKGSIHDVIKISNLSMNLIEELKKEFNYWYPMDLRHSGKDLIHNHLTFCIFQHQAIFRPELRPIMISTNGHLSVSGEKMSKSRGILTPLSEAVSLYSVDLTRMGLIGAGEGLEDANFSENEVDSYKRWLEQLKLLYQEKQTRDLYNFIDHWILSRMQTHIKEATAFAESLQTRSYTQEVLFGVLNDLRHYKKRTNDIGPGFSSVINTILLLLNPLIPHFSEELWSQKNDSFLVYEPYPKFNASLVNKEVEKSEIYLEHLLEDIHNIVKAMKIEEIKEIEITITPIWKEMILDEYLDKTKDKKLLISRIMQNSEIKNYGKQATQYTQKLLKTYDIIEKELTREKEYEILTHSLAYIESTLGCKVGIKYFEDSNSPKKQFSEPSRPAIYIK